MDENDVAESLGINELKTVFTAASQILVQRIRKDRERFSPVV